eukprot:scaffold153316_cov39-Prasinocladus_malaysianus.AAC.2
MNSSIENYMGIVANKSEDPQDVFLLQLGVHISESAVNNNRDCTHWQPGHRNFLTRVDTESYGLK